MNRDMVCSLRNRASPLSCVIYSTLIFLWHRMTRGEARFEGDARPCITHKHF